MKQLKWPISLFSLCAVESFQLRRAEFDENSENLNAFFSMFSNGMTYFEGYRKRWNGWSKSIFLENKVVINFDFRSGTKKSGHLDYPFKSYGPKFVSMHKTCGEVGVQKKSHGHNFDL